MKTTITFIDANEGNLDFFVGPFGTDNDQIKTATTIAEAAKIIQEHGLAESHYFSSSMDYATEFGFENDDGAKDMFESAITFAICADAKA